MATKELLKSTQNSPKNWGFRQAFYSFPIMRCYNSALYSKANHFSLFQMSLKECQGLRSVITDRKAITKIEEFREADYKYLNKNMS